MDETLLAILDEMRLLREIAYTLLVMASVGAGAWMISRVIARKLRP